VALGKKGIPLVFHELGHGGVNGGSVFGAKGHDSITVLMQVGPDKGELFLMVGVDGDLVKTGFTVNTDEGELAHGVAKVVKGGVAAWDGVFECFGDGVEWAIINAETPNELGDISDVFLMRFGCEDNFRAPRTATFTNPRVV
jgi:hypothetical protein